MHSRRCGKNELLTYCANDCGNRAIEVAFFSLNSNELMTFRFTYWYLMSRCCICNTFMSEMLIQEQLFAGRSDTKEADKILAKGAQNDN